MSIAIVNKTARQRSTVQVWQLLKLCIAVLVLVAITYFAIGAYMADGLAHAERAPLTSTPADQGLPYERVAFASAVDNIPLQGWFIGSGGHKTILMLHARNGRRDDPTVGLPDVARALVQNGYDVFAFDFRAHGESGGSHLGFGTLEVRDVAGALAYLRTRGIAQVGTIGFSMGAATTLNSAAEYPAMRAVVADSSFADLQLLLDTQVPRASGLPPFLLPGMELMSRLWLGSDLANDKPAHSVARLGERPVLLIHGTADEDVPLSHAYMLQQAGANDPNLQLWIVPGAEHVRAFKHVPDEYLKRVLAFFKQYL